MYTIKIDRLIIGTGFNRNCTTIIVPTNRIYKIGNRASLLAIGSVGSAGSAGGAVLHGRVRHLANVDVVVLWRRIASPRFNFTQRQRYFSKKLVRFVK